MSINFTILSNYQPEPFCMCCNIINRRKNTRETRREITLKNYLSIIFALFSPNPSLPYSKSFTMSRKDWSDGDIVLETDQLHITFDSSHGMMTVRLSWTLNKKD